MIASLVAWQIIAIAYLAIGVFFFCFFVYKKVFNLKRVGAIIGAMLACMLWPLGLLTLFFK